MTMVKKLTIIAAILVLLMLSGASLVLAQQDESMSSDISVEEVGPGGSDSVNAGFIQYNSELPPGSYYDCPPDTEPRMLRPCILVTP
jgi:hypothetical protein